MIVSSEKIREFIKEQHAIDGMVSIHDFELWLEEQPGFGDWIPCSLMLPEEGQTVLIQYVDRTDEENITMAVGLMDKSLNTYDDRVCLIADEPVAWMPLPEKYKVSRDELEIENVKIFKEKCKEALDGSFNDKKLHTMRSDT